MPQSMSINQRRRRSTVSVLYTTIAALTSWCLLKWGTVSLSARWRTSCSCKQGEDYIHRKGGETINTQQMAGMLRHMIVQWHQKDKHMMSFHSGTCWSFLQLLQEVINCGLQITGLASSFICIHRSTRTFE